MASILKVDTIQDQSGNNIINESADTITIGASGDTITVPSGATTTLTDGVSGDFKMNSGYGSVTTAYGCRAWVNFNGTGTVAIREDGNVTSITDGGTGIYTVNFTTVMPDANYCANLSIAETSGGAAAVSGIYATSAAPTSSAIRVLCVGNASDLLADTAFYNVAIFR
jgi:hypothetical protein